MFRLCITACIATACCFVFWPPRSFSHETLTTTVLFDREIVRILNRHCVMCHAENGPAFPLETYEQTWLQGRKMRVDAISRHMPPWAALPGYGEFVNDNSLTLRETQFIVSWVEGLGPRNAGAVFTNVANSGPPRAPIRARWDFGSWRLGAPSLTLEIGANTIGSGEGNSVKQVVVATNLKARQPIIGIEYLPGNPRVVRAAFFKVQETGEWIGSWTPWYGFMKAPEGAAYALPPAAHIVAEVHYRGAKEPVVERGKLGLFFPDKAAANTISDLVLNANHAAGARYRTEFKLPSDMHAVALRVEPAAGVKSVEVAERRVDGGTQVLFFGKDFPLDWPSPYIFKKPVLLHRGSVLSVTAYSGPVKVTMNRF